jgi:hypothetical protein
MEVKKLFLITFVLSSVMATAQQKIKTTAGGIDPKQQKKAERREKINQLIKQEEEGALIFQKQGAFGFKFNTDGWSMFYEHGKYKTITKTNLWWLELGERKHPKEEKIPAIGQSNGFLILSSYIYGKQNNFYYLKAGLGQQKLIGGKGNKNGVAVSAIYGGGITAGFLKPYYIQIDRQHNGQIETIKYDNNDADFLDGTIAVGRGGLTKGFSEMKFVPGAHARAALRFDYGRYNEVLSALEVGVNAEYYSKTMPILLLNKENKFFFNAYIALVFGKRK